MIRVLIIIILVILAFQVFFGVQDTHIGFNSRIIAFLNVVLFVTSLVCIGDFFRQGENIRVGFHLFNLIFTLVFYFIGIRFLYHHRDYYEGYARLSVSQCFQKFIMRFDIFSIMFWVILFAFILNIIYIIRHKDDYIIYES